MSILCKSPGYIRKWINSTQGAEAPIGGQTIIGNSKFIYQFDTTVCFVNLDEIFELGLATILLNTSQLFNILSREKSDCVIRIYNLFVSSILIYMRLILSFCNMFDVCVSSQF